MRKTLFLLFSLLLLALLFLPAAAKNTAVIDKAGLLTADEETALQSTLLSPKEDTLFFVVTDYGDEAPTNREIISLCGFSKEDPAVILAVRRSGGEYFYDLYTFGAADKWFTNGDVDDLLDDTAVYGNLKNGRVFDGSAAFLRLANSICINGEKRLAEKEAKKEAGRPLRAVLFGILSAAAVGGGATLGVFLFYRRKIHGEIYPLDRYAKLNLTVSKDIFVGRTVTRVRVQSSSSSGGSSGGFSGGHRGGR